MGLFACKACAALREAHERERNSLADEIAFLRAELRDVRVERKTLEDSVVALADKQAYAVRQMAVPRTPNQSPDGRVPIDPGIRLGLKRGVHPESKKAPLKTPEEIEAGFVIPATAKPEPAVA